MIECEQWTIGTGAANADLSSDELRRIVEQAFESVRFGKRVLAIIPDATRDDATAILFPIAAEILGVKGVEKFDALVAQGTHAPMSAAEKTKKIGADENELPQIFGAVYDHEWNNPGELVNIGELSARQVGVLSDGLFTESVALTVNRRIASGEYDTILIFSSTVPHEVAGFSGGAKYFFPGVSGRELTDATHWLGALASIANVIGKIETPTRRLIEAAATFVKTPVVCLNSVVTRTEENRLRTYAFFVGDVKSSFRRAAEISRQVHVKTVEKPFRRVIAVLDEHYDELWTGGKASYKLGGIIAEGGELIIYAPHLLAVSATHGAMIEKFGYAPLDIVRDWVKYHLDLRNDLCVAAHLAHVSYAGRTDENDAITSRFAIKLASALSAETCQKLNLGFIDYRQINWKEFRDDPETLVVERAGRDLYVLP